MRPVADGTELGRRQRDHGVWRPRFRRSVIGIINDSMAKADAEKGFILDGFRARSCRRKSSTGSSHRISNRIQGNGHEGLRVLQLLVPDDAIVRRITQRRTLCAVRGELPSGEQTSCDRRECVIAAARRSSRVPTIPMEAVRKRIESFHRRTLGGHTYTRPRKILREVDGIGSVDEIFERITQSLA